MSKPSLPSRVSALQDLEDDEADWDEGLHLIREVHPGFIHQGLVLREKWLV